MLVAHGVGRLVEPLTGRTWEPSEILARIQSRVIHFARCGLRRHDRVLLHHGNTLEFFVDLLEGHPTLYSARVGIHYRAIAQREGDLMIWVWIGHHSEYDALLRQRRKNV